MVPQVTTAPTIYQLAAPPAAADVAASFATQKHPFFLDSSMQGTPLGRWSFIGCEPFLVMRSYGRRLVLSDGDGSQEREIEGDPFEYLEALLKQYAVPEGMWPVPFVGGAVGYLGYDLGRLVERLPNTALVDHPELPEAYLAFYDTAVAYDHQEGRAFLISTGLPEPSGRGRAERAEQRLAWLASLVGSVRTQPSCAPPVGAPASSLRSTFSREAYLNAVQKAREYIIAGDVYQVNLSQRFETSWPGSAWDLYAKLRLGNPAPFSAYLDFGDVAVLSSSPERFLRLDRDHLETRPIKGTRPRGGTAAADTALAAELQSSPKDRAEHIMIVDLERSDLGRVSAVGSVHVPEMMSLETYATVHHLTSTVRGTRRPDRSIADILRATFPGGSITGVPKIRAMQIIEELEPTRRGIYTGAIGYFSASGSVDLNIAIRTIVLHNGIAAFQVGGGIVYDSDPQAEYQETLDKGRALAAALGAPDAD